MAEDGVKAHETEAEFLRDEGKALHPQTHTEKLKFGPHELDIRPLPLTLQHELGRILRSKREADLDDFDALFRKAIEGCALIAKFYGLGYDEKWIGENIADEAFTIIEQQFELGNKNSFVRPLVRSLFGSTRQYLAGVGEADLERLREHGRQIFADFGEKPTGLPGSARPGESPSPSSSPPTPKDS